MKTIQAPRASAIIYNLLMSQKHIHPWLLPANICPIVPITFMKAGVLFEFVDISAKTLHMDLNQAQARVKTREVGGILYAHTYGEESTPEEFFALAKSIHPEMLIVDDRCLCLPSFDESTSADVVLFSTGYAKIVELNFGGYAFIRDDAAYQMVKLNFKTEHHQKLEESYKIAIQDEKKFVYEDSDWLQTDDELPEWKLYRRQVEDTFTSSLAHRKALNEIYSSRLPKEIQLPRQYQTWRFNIRVKNKTQILKVIFENELFASSHYASLVGIMSEGNAPQSERLADQVINLFNDHHFTTEMAERICEIVVKIARW